VDYDWVNGRVKDWCTKISEEQYDETEGDFFWLDEETGERCCWRPNDLFRTKVRGMAPKVASDVLVPMEWIEAAWERWKEFTANKFRINNQLRLGVDVAGMGRDSSCFCPRFGDYVKTFEMVHSAGKADHMAVAGKTKSTLATNTDKFTGLYPSAFIDTIGEGAGVYSRLQELQLDRVYSVKFSAAPEFGGRVLKDRTEQYEFANLRAYLFWCIRDWLNPAYGSKAMLPPEHKDLATELINTKWEFSSNGKVKIESKDEIKKKIKRSPDKADALAMTFYPVEDFDPTPRKKVDISKYFF
jgi:hypothetical protein